MMVMEEIKSSDHEEPTGNRENEQFPLAMGVDGGLSMEFLLDSLYAVWEEEADREEIETRGHPSSLFGFGILRGGTHDRGREHNA